MGQRDNNILVQLLQCEAQHRDQCRVALDAYNVCHAAVLTGGASEHCGEALRALHSCLSSK